MVTECVVEWYAVVESWMSTIQAHLWWCAVRFFYCYHRNKFTLTFNNNNDVYKRSVIIWSSSSCIHLFSFAMASTSDLLWHMRRWWPVKYNWAIQQTKICMDSFIAVLCPPFFRCEAKRPHEIDPNSSSKSVFVANFPFMQNEKIRSTLCSSSECEITKEETILNQIKVIINN